MSEKIDHGAILAELAALEKTDEILSNPRHHSPVALAERRAALRNKLLAEHTLAATSAAAVATDKATAEIEKFIEAMRVEHGPALDEMSRKHAELSAEKAAAVEQIRKLQARCNEIDIERGAVEEERTAYAGHFVNASFVKNHWSKNTIPNWNRAIDVLDRVCAALRLNARRAARELVIACAPGASAQNNFRAAIVTPPVRDKNTQREI